MEHVIKPTMFDSLMRPTVGSGSDKDLYCKKCLVVDNEFVTHDPTQS